MSRNYHTKLSAEIITGNYDLAYYVEQKCVNYRDTDISKKKERSDNIPNRQKGDFYADFVHVFSYRFNRFSHAKI